MAISVPSDIKKFKSAVTPLFVFVFAIAMTVLVCLVLVKDGRHFDRRALAYAAGFQVLFSLGCSWLLSLFFPEAFSPDGIYGHSFWGQRSFVAWRDVTAARTFRLLNLRWLRVYSTSGKVTWVALFQSQGTEFRQEVRRLAPA